MIQRLSEYTKTPLLQACMAYSYRNPEAALVYDGFRGRAEASVSAPWYNPFAQAKPQQDEWAFVDAVPCLLHPVKPGRASGGRRRV